MAFDAWGTKPAYFFLDREAEGLGDDDEEMEDFEEESPWLKEGDAAWEAVFSGSDAGRSDQLPAELAVTPSMFTEYAFRMPDEQGDFLPFSFEGRRHMKHIYDRPARRILLCTARQTEKTVRDTTLITMANGELRVARDVQVGDRVATMALDGQTLTTRRVTWKSRFYSKPCLRITTRQGHVTEVATTHPMRTWGAWTPAGKLRVGDRLAVVRQAGNFGRRAMPLERIRLTAYMIGDGSIQPKQMSLTSVPGRKADEFIKDVKSIGGVLKVYDKKGTRAQQLRVRSEILYNWFVEDGLLGAHSADKFLPSWVFQLPREQAALFLNRLWSTDGHVRRRTRSQYNLVYVSISRRLVREVQALLWKFGIPSGIRKNWPSIYKKRGEKKFAYLLHVETQEGVRRFLTEIGALEKSENCPLPTVASNNNQDTLPHAVTELIQRIYGPRRNTRKGGALLNSGLRRKPGCAPTYGKLARYVEYFRSKPHEFDQKLVSELEGWLTTDLYWDRITRIERIGRPACVDFEVDGTHNFIADGFVTHNSTLLGNLIIAHSCLMPAMHSLYVSPSQTQTKTFSRDRINEPLETSPVLQRMGSQMIQANLFEKQFANRSKVTMRYAFLNANRTRGVARVIRLYIDEFQDILSTIIPVIEQTTAHAPAKHRAFVYAGTPKTFDNNIEYYRANLSTMGEWVVPCPCRTGEAGRHWNVLTDKNIGLKGLICEKCGKLIDPQHRDAQWAFMAAFDEQRRPFESYRIPQLMVPWRPWSEILLDYNRYPRDQFQNEVLGLSCDSGLRPLTHADLIKACNPDVRMDRETVKKWLVEANQGRDIFMGIDWGGGTENSYTVVTVGAYVGARFRVIWAHRFTGADADPDLQVVKIKELIKRFRPKVIGMDFGGGLMQYSTLVREFGTARVQRFMYVAKAKKKVFRDNANARFRVVRTEAMGDLFSAIKRNQFEFPNWDEFREPFAQDMLNIYAEYSTTLHMLKYDHKPDKPDDTFHSLLYCFLGSMLVIPRPDIISPRREHPNVGPIWGPSALYSGPTNQGRFPGN